MADREQQHQQLTETSDQQALSSDSQKEDMISYVMAMEAALLPCLPARKLQAIDRSPNPSHQNQEAIDELLERKNYSKKMKTQLQSEE